MHYRAYEVSILHYIQQNVYKAQHGAQGKEDVCVRERERSERQVQRHRTCNVFHSALVRQTGRGSIMVVMILL